MARMRTLKPEFWDSPSTANASLAARLLFLAMWNWADDSGRGTAGFKELEAFAFPNDDIRTLPRDKAGNSAPMAGTSPGRYRSFAELCGDVAEAYGVQFYRVKSRPYYVIPSFKAHQAKDFRLTSKHPKEDEGEFFDVTSGNTFHTPDADPQETESAGTSAHDAGNSASIAGKKNTVIGEKGKRVIGEEGSKESESDKPTTRPKTVTPEHRATDDAYATTGKAFNFIAVRQIAKWAIHERGLTEAQASSAIVAAYEAGKPITRTVIGQLIDGIGRNAKQTTMGRVEQTLGLGQALQAKHEAPQLEIIHEAEYAQHPLGITP